MKKFLSALSIAILAMGACAPLAAQTHVVPVYSYPSAGTPPSVVLQCDANADNCTPTSALNPLVVSSSSGTGTLASQVQGNSASAAADVGNPVKVGCVFLSVLPTVTTGQRVDVQCDNRGRLYNGPFVATATTAADGASNTIIQGTRQDNGSSAPFGVAGYVFNGTTWDRMRGDTTGQYVVDVPSASTNAGVPVNATTVAAGSLIAKASAGNMYGYNVTSGASAGYVLIFNSATVPADGVVTPARCMPLAANTGLEVDMRGQPTFFSAGMVIVFSTTGCFTKTISATAFIAADVK